MVKVGQDESSNTDLPEQKVYGDIIPKGDGSFRAGDVVVGTSESALARPGSANNRSGNPSRGGLEKARPRLDLWS